VRTTDTPTGRELDAAITSARKAYRRHRNDFLRAAPLDRATDAGMRRELTRQATAHARCQIRISGQRLIASGKATGSASMVTLGLAYQDVASGRITCTAPRTGAAGQTTAMAR
jgi:hypothetical protein